MNHFIQQQQMGDRPSESEVIERKLPRSAEKETSELSLLGKREAPKIVEKLEEVAKEVPKHKS